ncbi:MAG: MOSC domain-containing protein [Acidimicrobiia bacterium]
MEAATSGSFPALLSVNVGRPRTIEWRGRQVTTAIWMEPLEGSVRIEGENLVGDEQADRRVHGGADKAVYAYAAEDYDWWSTSTGPLTPGTFGENLTTTGIDLSACQIGDRWYVGSAVLEVAQPRSPCFKLGIRIDDETFPERFAAAQRPGVYLRIIVPGAVTQGDAILVSPTEPPAVTIGSLVDDDVSEHVLRAAAADARVPHGWRRAATRSLLRTPEP